MNSHSFPPSHSRSSLHNDTIYSSTSHNNTRYYSTIHRPRPHNMTQLPDHHHQLSHAPHHSHIHQNLPWSASTMVPPPPVLQEVYILDCRSCDTFLTNRGMRAVLLLQPDVPLYSSDALPVNCSANPGPSDYAPSHDTDASYMPPSSCPAGMPPPPPRTCECLTQTLCCHGCGNAVGYMVVIPCHRCCSSVSPANRHTNRHRFVFFNKEIKASARHYIPHEPGIITSSPLLVSAVTPTPSLAPSYDPNTRSPSITRHATSQFEDHNLVAESAPSLPTPPPDSPVSTDHMSAVTHASPPSPNSYQQPNVPSVQFVVFKPERGKLRAGDVVYWHNLSRSGEIPAVVEDDRARYSVTEDSIGNSSLAGR